jgi:hypothetical protein
MIKVGRVRLGGIQHARTKFQWGKTKARNHLGDLGKDGKVILKWILNNYGMKGEDLIQLA